MTIKECEDGLARIILKEDDTEADHKKADDIIIEFLYQREDYRSIAKRYKAIKKWYA